MNLLVYLLQVNLALLICLALFFFALRPLTFFKWNRYYLLTSVVLSLLLPLFNLQVSGPMEGVADLTTIDWQYVDHLVTTPVEISTAVNDLTAGSVLLSVYLLTSLSLLVFSIWRNRMFFLSATKAKQFSNGRIKVYLHEHHLGSFTIFRRIYLNRETDSESFPHVLRHEMVHAAQLHSLDLVFMELVVVFLWFNPFVFLLLRYIRDNHEYLADDDARETPNSLVDYLVCLKAETMRLYSPAIASDFKCSTIKKRIIMLTNSRSNNHYKWRYLGFIPLVVFMMVLFHTPAEKTVASPSGKLEAFFQAAPFTTNDIPSIFPLPASYKERITWEYNEEAKHPISGEKTRHLGIDIAAPTGTPVYATGSGIVKKAEEQDGWGMMIVLEHPDGYSTLYGHLSQFEVKSGEKVATGQVIGEVGNTGRSTGSHLHYEVRKEGNPVDPGEYY